MTPAYLKAAFVALGIKPAAFARATGLQKSTPGKWLSGKAPVPRWADILIGEALRSRRFRSRLFGDAYGKPPFKPAKKGAGAKPRSKPGARRAYEQALSKKAGRAIKAGAKVTKCKPDSRLKTEATRNKRRAATKRRLAAHFRAVKKK